VFLAEVHRAQQYCLVPELPWSFATSGKHRIKAVYNGDANFLPSTAAALPVTI
jgi:hypothetical protein